MNKFRNLGFISYNGKIEVNSSLLNAVLYESPRFSASRNSGCRFRKGQKVRRNAISRDGLWNA